jgi:hypothetical protein
MNMYRRFLLQHSQIVTALEALIPSITWCLPERFSTSEIPAEVLNTISGLISVFNEHVLCEFKPSTPHLLLTCIHQVEVLLEITANNLEQHGTLRSKYSLLLILEAIKAAIQGKLLHESNQKVLVPRVSSEGEQTEASQDNLAKAFHILRTEGRKAEREAQLRGQGEDAVCASNVYWWTSGHKHASRSLMKCPSARDVQHSGVNSVSAEALNVETISDSAHEQAQVLSGALPATSHPSLEEAALKPCWFFWQDASSYTHRIQDTEARQKDRRSTHDSAFATASTSKPSRSEKHSSPPAKKPDMWQQRQHGHRLISYGEVLHIARPVIYVAFLRRFGRQSWVPWLAALACDLIGHGTTSRGFALLEKASATCSVSAAPFTCTSASMLCHMAHLPISSLERRELNRRLFMLLWYLMRDPLYARTVSPQLERLHATVSWIPLIGFLSRRCLDIVEGVQQYYVYTSAS